MSDARESERPVVERARWVGELVRESVERGERSLDRDIEEYARRLDALRARR